MGKLEKFFRRFSSDKFPKDSLGHRLNEPRPRSTTKETSQDIPRTPRNPPSEEAMKAADAALRRIEAKQVPTKTPVQRMIDAENARLKKEMTEAEALAAQFNQSTTVTDNGGAVKNVSFSCPRLLGDGVRGTYSEIDSLIERMLIEESVQDPAAAYTLLIIRSIEFSQYPAGFDTSSESAPSIQTFRDKRRQNFITIIRNLIENYENESYRRLRMGNKLISDLLELKFADKFFETCGFTQTEQPKNSEEDTSTERYLVFPSVPTEDQLNHMKSMLNLLESGELIVPKLNRDTTIFQVSGRGVRDLSKEELPAEFFLVSREDVRKWREEYEIMEKEKVLLTKAMRERLNSRNRRLYRYALIRIRLPSNDILIQGTFMATETISDVRCWISSCLVDQGMEYSLWAPPGQLPTTTLSGGGRPLTARVLLDDFEPSATIVDLGLAPSAILTLAVNPTAHSSVIRILPELEQQIVPLE